VGLGDVRLRQFRLYDGGHHRAADRRLGRPECAAKKKLLAFTTAGCVLFTGLLYFAQPEIAQSRALGRVSGWACACSMSPGPRRAAEGAEPGWARLRQTLIVCVNSPICAVS